jgi:DNA-binding XRE family transcriptional regulator
LSASFASISFTFFIQCPTVAVEVSRASTGSNFSGTRLSEADEVATISLSIPEAVVGQEALAHRSGLSPTEMGFLETGKRWPRLDTLMSVADGLNITVDELLNGLHKPSKRR